MSDLEQLQKAITALEAQRATLGNEVVDAALASMREKLARLKEEQPPSGPQLKYVTVLFTDIVGSTHLAQRLDPEEIMGIMNTALQRFDAIIEQHGGRVLRFMGDGLKAVFGAPAAQEDDAEQAVRVGLALLQDTQTYAGQVKADTGIEGFNIRVGINTGQVVLGGGVEADNTAMGMTINLAARMESTAPPGSLRISYETYRHMRGIFDVQPQAPLVVKGQDEPIQTYLVLRAKPRAFRTTTRGVEGVETRMVGRQAELKELQSAFETAMRASETRLFTVVGDPGVGKSRLLFEFEQWIDLRPERVRLFRGRASQSMSATPYSLLRDLFAFRFDILESDSAETLRQKLETGLGEFLEQDNQMKAHVIGAWLGYNFQNSPHLPGIQNDPKQLREQALFYLGQFFNAVARRSPTLLFLEDIHWADEASLATIQQLVHENPGLRLFVICSARPTLFETTPKWGARQGKNNEAQAQIRLRRLAPKESQQLVDEILQKVQAVPEALRELIVTRAEGNPFYVEELIKILIEDGVILKDEAAGAWRVAPEKLPELRVPPTLTAVLQARLDSLPVEEKVTLQQASVMGRVFWDAALKELEGALKPPAQPLAGLSHRELIYPHRTSAFENSKEYIFKHALLRDVTYESVLKRERRAYHRRVAGWLATATQASGRVDEYAALIAEHYALAGEASDAIDWFLRAGERANGQGAYQEARRLFDRALEGISPEDRERRYQALKGRSLALGTLGELEAYQADLTAMLELAREAGNDAWLAFTYNRQASALASQGDDRLAVQVYQMALEGARKAEDRRLEARILSLLVISQTRLGVLAGAAANAEKALALAHELGDEDTESVTLGNVVVYFIESGDLARAALLSSQAVELYRRLGNRFGEAVGLANLGYNYILLGRLEPGRLALQRSIHLADAIGARRHGAYARLNLGLALWRSGENQAAQQALEKCAPDLTATGDAFGQAANLSYYALTLESSNDAAGAQGRFSEAREMFSRHGVFAYANDTLAGLARCALALGDLVTARKHALELWGYLTEHGSKGMEFPIRAYLTCGEIFQAIGELELARSAVEAGSLDLHERAGKINNPEWRNSFLENVPEHRKIIQLERQLKG